MKRTLFRVSVALLTLALGVSIIRVLRSFLNRANAVSPASVSLVTVPATATDHSSPGQVADNEGDPLEAVYIDGDKLSYQGYDVERTTTNGGWQSSATIKKDGRVIATLDNGGLGKESTRFGLFSLLGGEQVTFQF